MRGILATQIDLEDSIRHALAMARDAVPRDHLVCLLYKSRSAARTEARCLAAIDSMADRGEIRAVDLHVPDRPRWASCSKAPAAYKTVTAYELAGRKGGQG